MMTLTTTFELIAAYRPTRGSSGSAACPPDRGVMQDARVRTEAEILGS
jgi:hypothetical protein